MTDTATPTEIALNAAEDEVAPPHPAKFPIEIIGIFKELLLKYGVKPFDMVLDPFAGTGRIHMLRPDFNTIGVEIEPEWALMSPYTTIGNALDLPDIWTDMFAAIATSPTYGNRMADHHNAQEVCRLCSGTGSLRADISTFAAPDVIASFRCPDCNGVGNNEYKRLTYTHQLGHALHPDNSGGMQWGKKYKEFHAKAWIEAIRVLRPGGLFLLNCKNHIRKGEVQEVTEWHIRMLVTLGCHVLEEYKLPVKSMKFGTNRDNRIDYELIVALQKES